MRRSCFVRRLIATLSVETHRTLLHSDTASYFLPNTFEVKIIRIGESRRRWSSIAVSAGIWYRHTSPFVRQYCNLPRVATVRQWSVLLNVVVQYWRLALSARLGERSWPSNKTIYSCASCWVSGNGVYPRITLILVQLVLSTPPPIKSSVNPAMPS